MAEIWIGDAKLSDVAGIQKAAELSWRATYKDIFSEEFITRFLEQAYASDALERSVTGGRSDFLVARDGERVIGFCHFGPSLEGETELYRLYVVPEYWRKGIGGRLVEMMEGRLSSRGVAAYHCYVHTDNEIGKSFYARRGFAHVPARDRSDGHCEVCLVRRLA
jgi:diamine N-acetyltransferase